MERISNELHLTEEEALALDIDPVHDVRRAPYLYEYARLTGQLATRVALGMRQEAMRGPVDVCEYITIIHRADVAERVASAVARIEGLEVPGDSGEDDTTNAGESFPRQI